jgi:hypothetical protein
MRDIPKWPGKLEHRGKDPTGLGRRDIEDFEGKRN